jgi:hypothetical protein
MEYSSCCGASRHHIWDELCAECLDHCEFEDDYSDFKTWNEAPYGDDD